VVPGLQSVIKITLFACGFGVAFPARFRKAFLTIQAQQETLRQFAEKVATTQGVELVDLLLASHGKRSQLRIFIDKAGGVTIDDCTHFSRSYEALLEAENALAGPTTLEVSSPGLDKPLKLQKDFLRNLGKKIDLRFKPNPEEKKEQKLVCTLLQASEHSISIQSAGKDLTIPLDQVLMAKVHVDI